VVLSEELCILSSCFLSPMSKNSVLELRDWQLDFNVPFQHKYGYIRDKRSGVERNPYPVKEG